VQYHDRIVGVVGEYKSDVRRSFKLPDFSAGFELFLSGLEGGVASKYTVLSSYPKIQQDITFEVDNKLPFSEVFNALNEELLNRADEHGYHYVILPWDIFKPDDSEKKRLTFRVWLSHSERTLTTSETNLLLDETAQTLHVNIKADRI